VSYRVVYLGAGARRVWHPGSLTLDGAKRTLRFFKRHGMTAWVVDERGDFVPVPGAKRQPSYLD